MDKTYDIIEICKYIINQHDKHSKNIDRIKLQSLLYFVQVKFLVYKNRPCFPDEMIADFQGAHIPAVFKKYASYGSNPLPAEDNNIKPRPSDAKLINSVIDKYYDWSTFSVLALVKSEEPFKRVFMKKEKGIEPVISMKALKEYYERGKNGI